MARPFVDIPGGFYRTPNRSGNAIEWLRSPLDGRMHRCSGHRIGTITVLRNVEHRLPRANSNGLDAKAGVGRAAI
ncbi:MAG TPA: hypothetical protein VIJ77_06995 [Candidatus Tumulicola sp.]